MLIKTNKAQKNDNVPEQNNHGNGDVVKRLPCDFLASRHLQQHVLSLARPQGRCSRSSEVTDEMRKLG